MERRNFLQQAGFALGAGLGFPVLNGFDNFSISSSLPREPEVGSRFPLNKDWLDVRNQFSLEKGKIHMAQMLLASHPKVVQQAIDRHRKNFDANPGEYWEENFISSATKVLNSAAAYLKADPTEIALTESTTQGLGTLYSGFKLNAGDQILTTTHDHYSTEMALKYASDKNGATIQQVSLYDDPAQTSEDEIVERMVNAVNPKTRLIAVTWVHSSTGVKLPIRRMADAIREINKNSSERIYFAVDGVHGFGVENTSMDELGCDFFVAGTHKWLFGPRGTGIIWARKDTWDKVIPTIPPFTIAYAVWLGQVPEGNLTFSDLSSPGGFHAFEHRWALNEAFDFHENIGKDKIEQRTHQLSNLLKEGLREIDHVKIHTPLSSELSSGINCFEVAGLEPEEVVQRLHKVHIVGSTSPYRISYARLTPCIINTEEEVMRCIKALEEIKS